MGVGPSSGVKLPRRWNASWVDAAPGGEHTDPATQGLQLRVRSHRTGESRTFLFRFKWRSKPLRIVVGHRPTMSLADAREAVHQMRQALDNGIDPRRARPRRRQASAPDSLSASSPDARHTVEFLVSEFVTRYLRPLRKRPEYAEAILNRDVLTTWRGRDARTIMPGEVIELLDAIVDRGSKVMANRTAGLLGQLFKFGIHRQIVANTPVQLLYRPGGTEKPRQRALSDDELRAFLADPKDVTRFERSAHAMMILLLTGQRRGELALARKSEVDLVAKEWTIPDANAKGGRGHIVPLSDWAVDEFSALFRLSRGSQWILPAVDPNDHLDPKQLTRSVAKCQKRFKERGIGPFTIHDLRRTCRTGLGELGIDTNIAELVLNHAREKIEGTYDVHKYMPQKREALEKWAAHLRTLT